MASTQAEGETGKAAVDTGSAWRRLSPIAILYFTASNVKKLVSFGIYAVPAVAVSINAINLQSKPYVWSAIIAAALLVAMSGAISYFFYQFRVRSGHVEIRLGVLNRRYINLPFWRIQNVKINTPFYYRLTQFVVVVLDTAGSAQEEAEIVAVSGKYANKLRQQILAERHQYVEQQADNTDEKIPSPSAKTDSDTDEEILNQRSLYDLFIHGITNNRVWILLGAAAPFYDNLYRQGFSWLESNGLSLQQLLGEQNAAWWQLGIYSLTILLIVMGLLALISVGGSVLTFYGYTLSRQGDRYVRRSGLLNKQEVSMRRSRVQVIAVKQDWLDKVLGRANLFFEQNKASQQPEQDLSAANTLLVPSVTPAEAEKLSQGLMPDITMGSAKYRAISKRFLWHHWFIRLLPAYVLLMIVTLMDSLWQVAVIGTVGAMLLGTIIGLRWWRWGVAWDGEYIYVRSGIIGIDYQCFQPFKVQQAAIKQSVLMKRRKVATVQFVMASGSITVPYMDEEEALALINSSLYAVEKSRRSWM
ncbi:PH domain-containing protein [Alteromonas pelagimontana]|uniref:PH domain-containing protein n=1 Tax=Alteromonas pelagimontana TaxID=1858656 RepID=UPI00094FED47|nr:PH domain-containing protein [Alteromonas pelagimontana]